MSPINEATCGGSHFESNLFLTSLESQLQTPPCKGGIFGLAWGALCDHCVMGLWSTGAA